MMAITTIYTVRDICWYAQVWNVHNTTQERGAERTGGLFLLANLLVLPCRQMCGAHMAAEAYWNRNGLQVQWSDISRWCLKSECRQQHNETDGLAQDSNIFVSQRCTCSEHVLSVCSSGLWWRWQYNNQLPVFMLMASTLSVALARVMATTVRRRNVVRLFVVVIISINSRTTMLLLFGDNDDDYDTVSSSKLPYSTTTSNSTSSSLPVAAAAAVLSLGSRSSSPFRAPRSSFDDSLPSSWWLIVEARSQHRDAGDVFLGSERHVVIDEMDTMLEQGFQGGIGKLLHRCYIGRKWWRWRNTKMAN